MIYALVKNGVVSNVTEWDGNPETWTAPAGFEAVPVTDGAGVGWTYDGETFSPPQAEAAYWTGHKLKFAQLLFTTAENIAWDAKRLDLAKMTGAELVDPANVLMAYFARVERELAMAETIDTREPSVASGLDVLIALGIIQPERKAEILAGVLP